jgi:hypothetical protein
MPISDTLTRRLEAAKQAATPDPLIINPISSRVRNQFWHALWGLLDRLTVDDWHAFTEVLRTRWDTERGVYDRYMRSQSPSNLRDDTHNFFVDATDEEARDFIEIGCSLSNMEIRGHFVRKRHSEIPINNMLIEVNTRLREAQLAYRFEPQLNQLIIEISQQTHKAIIRPTLSLLAQPGFEIAKQDFAAAFELLADGNWKDAVTAAGRAFEATMKAICTSRGWAFDSAKSRAGDLVTICVNKGLFPPWFAQSAQAFVAMMKSGVSSVRNNAGAHGQAPDDEAVTETIARYAINQAAATMLLLLERHRDLGPTS